MGLFSGTERSGLEDMDEELPETDLSIKEFGDSFDRFVDTCLNLLVFSFPFLDGDEGE